MTTACMLYTTLLFTVVLDIKTMRSCILNLLVLEQALLFWNRIMRVRLYESFSEHSFAKNSLQRSVAPLLSFASILLTKFPISLKAINHVVDNLVQKILEILLRFNYYVNLFTNNNIDDS